MKCEKLFARIDELQEEYIGFWSDIVAIESPTNYKPGVDAVGNYFIEKAKQRGWQVEVHKEDVSGDAICLTMNPEASGKPIVFSGHMDTVHPLGFFGSPIVRRDDTFLYGPGVQDCKGGIAGAFLAMAALQDVGFTARPVKLVLQSDEENSSVTSDKRTVDFMEKCAKGCAVFLNVEPYIPDLCTIGRKGIADYRFTITGKACHASVCHQGISAIAEAARKVLELEKIKEREDLTFNVGTITGGTSVNTTPAQCTFFLDVRFRNTTSMNRADEIVHKIAETSYIEGTTCELELVTRRVPMEETDAARAALAKLNEVCRENGITEMKPGRRPGGSDAADMTTRGIVTLDSLGTLGGGSHTIREHSYLTSLARCAKRLAGMAYCME